MNKSLLFTILVFFTLCSIARAADPMRIQIRTALPEHIVTVGPAAQYYAEAIGYRLITDDPAPPESRWIAQRSINPLVAGNRILATAAYNAGPNRVSNWLRHQQQGLEYDVWIETLPYQETRHYVQNVLTYSVIYGYRLGKETTLVSQNENFIQ